MAISRAQMGSQLKGNKMKKPTKTKKMAVGGGTTSKRPSPPVPPSGVGPAGFARAMESMSSRRRGAGPKPAAAAAAAAGMVKNPARPRRGVPKGNFSGIGRGMLGPITAAAGPVRGGAGPKPRPPYTLRSKNGGMVAKKSTGGKLKGPKR